jgi:C-terminal processing protease CtpA/Prc
MASPKKQKRNFNGMSYSEVQSVNSKNRSQLKKEYQQWLKDNSYKNVGWDNVINLYKKIEEFIEKSEFEDMSLEELFLEADRIGNKYLSPKEIEDFNQQLSKEVAEIGDLIEQQFPDTEIEIIDYSNQSKKKFRQQRNQKTYRTTKL